MNTTDSTMKCHKNQQRCRHLYAQKLNNSAASCIDIGQYDRAISSLSKALKLSEQEEEVEPTEEQEPTRNREEKKQEHSQENHHHDDDDDDVMMEDGEEDNED